MGDDESGERTTPRHFTRVPEREGDGVVAFWRDAWADRTDGERGPARAVWVLANPLGQGRFSVRTATVGPADALADLPDSTHVASADTADAAKAAAIAWMADQT